MQLDRRLIQWESGDNFARVTKGIALYLNSKY